MDSAAWVDIEDGLTASTALAAIELRRDYAPDAPALVIEGPDDMRLFNKLTLEECVVVPAGNRDGVIEAVRQANERGMQVVLGVVDRDYSDFRDEQLPENLVMTDQNDIEVMLILSGALAGVVLESVGQWIAVVEIEGCRTELASHVIVGVSLLGQLRALKHEAVPRLNFAGLRLRNHLLADGVSLDSKALAEELQRRSDGVPASEELERLRREMESRDIPVEMLACGHDAVQYLCITIQAGLLGKPLRLLSERDCASLLRSSYQPSEFAAGGLSRRIVDWCGVRNVKMLVGEATP
jgi:Protein of unknown function (DUF4435)